MRFLVSLRGLTRIMRSILLLLSVLLVLPVTIQLALCSLVVLAPKMLGILVDMDQKDSYGDVGKDCALALLGVVLEFIAECGYGADGKDCALALQGLVLVFTAAGCSSSTRSKTPCREAEVPLWQLTDKVCMVPRLQAWRRLSIPHRCCARQRSRQCLRSSWTRSSCPLLCKTGGCPDSAETCEVSARVLGHGVDISVVAQRQLTWAWLFSRPRRFSCCSTLTRCSTIWLCFPTGSSGADVEKTVEIPQLQLGEVGFVFFFMAVCTGTRPGLTPAIRAGKGWR